MGTQTRENASRKSGDVTTLRRPRMLVQLTDVDLAQVVAEVLQAARDGECVARVAYSPREWATALGVSHPVVYRWIREGMPVVKRGGVTRVIPSESLAWLRSAAGAPEAAE